MKCACGCGGNVALSDRDKPSRGVRKGEPNRFIAGHNARLPLTFRVMQRVPPAGVDECWLWNGGKNKHYAAVSVGGKYVYVHRLMYEGFIGPVPDGMDLHHVCENKQCVNPHHLKPVSRQDHMSEHAPTQLHQRSPVRRDEHLLP